MKLFPFLAIFLLLGITFQQPVLAKVSTPVVKKVVMAKSAANPAVKKSVNSLCHVKGTKYYNQTKKFVAYVNIAACLKSGGKLPKK
ncbi:MAG: hypothetical protein K8Q97_02305 [Candidatus Andersenbacteria bacterium]|nr:hypothetical protein [Candidatus Andersenbacteria bacterium]